MSTTTQTEEKAKSERLAQEKAQSLSAINAAEAILLPLGFTRTTGKDYFNLEEKGRVDARWHLASPKITATLSTQSKPWSQRPGLSDDRFDYRLAVDADDVWSLRAPRLSPGNRQGVVDFIERVKEALKEKEADARRLKFLAKLARDTVAREFKNLRITSVDVIDDLRVEVRVKNKNGTVYSLLLSRTMRFIAIKASPDEDTSLPLASVTAALRAL